MRKTLKTPLLLLLSVLLFNVLAVSSTILLHESGHFLLGLSAECKNIKLVLMDSELKTYTEMSCPNEQSAFFPLAGAFLLTFPFALLLLLLKDFPERNFFWIILGFNLIIAVVDFPAIIALQIFSFVLGISLVVFGEILLIDKLLLFIVEKV